VTQIAQFALVVVGVAVASLWALLRGSLKWFLLVVGAFVAWLVLPSVIMQTEWGYYRENGLEMANPPRAAFKADSEYWAKQDGPLAAQVCGDAEGFDVNDPSLQWIGMPEQAVVKHFFYYSKYSNVIWLGVGWKDRFCLARYLVVNEKERDISPLPTQLFPYPFFPWFPHTKGVEERLIERLRSAPNAPEGVRSLFPGQCVTGDLAKGETARFQVQMPYFGQKIKLDVSLQYVCQKDFSGLVEWTKNGRPVVGLTDESHGGGLYQITLRAPVTEAKLYVVGVFWGVQDFGCRRPKGWWDKYNCTPDTDAAGASPN
jgi:hypothetical protein